MAQYCFGNCFFSKTLPSGGFLIKTKIGKTYLGKTAKGHHFEVSDRDSNSKTADGQDFGVRNVNRQHNSWPTTTTTSWPPKKTTPDWPPRHPQDKGPATDSGLGQTPTPKIPTPTPTPTTTTTTTPTTPGWKETTTTKDSWPPRTTTTNHWKQRDERNGDDWSEDADDGAK